jgi:hypothetical protein
MARAALLALAICLALFLSTSSARADHPNRFGPLTPEQKRELEQRAAYGRFALCCLAGVLTLGAIGQLVFSIRNFLRAGEERRRAWEEETREEEANDALNRGLPPEFEVEEPECDEPIDVPAPRRQEHRQEHRPEPCGIIANHVDRGDLGP